MIAHFFKYLLGEISIKILGFVSLPVFTYFLTPKEFGVFSLFLAYVSIAGTLLTLNLHTAVSRFFYEKGLDVKSLLSTTLILTISMLLISFTIIFFIDSEFLSSILSFDFELYGIYFAVLVVCNVFFQIYSQTLIPQQKSKEYVFLNSIRAYFTFFVVVCFLYFVNNNALERIHGVVVAELFVFLYIAYKLFDGLKFSISVENIKYITNYSIFLMPYVLAGVVMAQIDRVMLAKYVSTAEVGIYSVAYVLSFIPMLLFSAIGKAWTPYYFQYMDDKNYNKLSSDTMNILLFITFFIVTISLFSNEIVFILLDEKYAAVKHILPMLTLTTLFTVMWQVWGRSIGYAKKTIWISYIGLISAMVNVILNYYLIPIYQIQGAVYATLVSYIVMSFLGYFVSKFYLKIYTVSIASLKYVFMVNALMFMVILLDQNKVIWMLKSLYFIIIVYLIIKYKKRIPSLYKMIIK